MCLPVALTDTRHPKTASVPKRATKTYVTTLHETPTLPTFCVGSARDVSMDSTQEASQEDMGDAGEHDASVLSRGGPSAMDEEIAEPELSASAIEGMTVGGLPPLTPLAPRFFSSGCQSKALRY